MNERIQELYLEAAEHMKTVQDQGLPAPYQTRALAGKLAELIVRECADTAENCFVYWQMDGSLQRKGCANAIKKHFGVE